jgi:hypothetical protein
MATVDMTAGTSSTVGGGVFRISNTVDLQVANDKLVANGDGAFASTDVVQCLSFPANLVIYNVYVTIKEASAATTLTATVGDDDDPNGWDAAVDLEGAAGTITRGEVGTDAYAVAGGTLFTTANTVDLVLTVDTVTSLGSINVVAECFDPTLV